MGKRDSKAEVLANSNYRAASCLFLICIIALYAVLPPAVHAAPGDIVTIAGGGPDGLGDGGLATSATLSYPTGVAVDTSGNIYIADTFNNRIRVVYSSGTITTVAGNGIPAYSGDGGPATSASLNYPTGVSVDALGNIYIADTVNHRIRVVYSSGTITTLAGNGTGTYSGDGGPATSASLNDPFGVTVDALGNVYIADRFNHRIRKVTSGTITTVAGNGTGTYSGDDGPATSASLRYPDAVFVDASGNIYIADSGNNRIRKVDHSSGTITTVAGNGTGGYSGDGDLATSASLYSPAGVSADALGNIYIADLDNSRIRRVDASGIITTVAGNGTAGYSGDNGPATSASLDSPSGVLVDALENIYIADYNNHRIREVSPAPSIRVTDSIPPINDLQMPFSSVTQGNISDQTVVVTNSGTIDLVIGTIASLAAPFSITTDNCSEKTIAPSSICTLTVRFAPTTIGTFSGSFDIPSNDPTKPTVTLSVSGTGLSSVINHAPSAPTLVFPANNQTGLGTTVQFQWKKATDPDGDAVTYDLYTSSTDSSFTGCTPLHVSASSPASKVYLAGLGMYGGLMMLGMVFAGSRKGRKGLVLLLIIIVLLTTGITLASCGRGGSGRSSNTPPPPSDEVSYTVSNLSSGTTYYWKVVADDSKGGTTPSATWSFKTQ